MIKLPNAPLKYIFDTVQKQILRDVISVIIILLFINISESIPGFSTLRLFLF